MNKIVFELCPEDRARLDDIIAGLRNLNPQIGAGEAEDACAAMIAEFGAPAAEEHPIDAPVEHFDPPASDPEPEPEVPVVSLGEFQKAIVVRCAASPEMKKKVQALVKKYAASVSAVPEEKRAEVLAALAEL